MAFDSQSAFQKDWPNYTFLSNVYKFHDHTPTLDNLYGTFLLSALVVKWRPDVLICISQVTTAGGEKAGAGSGMTCYCLQAYQKDVCFCRSLSIIWHTTPCLYEFPANDFSCFNAWSEAWAALTATHPEVSSPKHQAQISVVDQKRSCCFLKPPH